MDKKSCKLLAFSLMVLFVTGCAGKQYSQPEFYGLPSDKQNELCQEWANTVPGNITLTTYTVRYDKAGDYNTSAEMNAAAASLGSALGARTAMKHRERVAYNFGYCTERHFTKDLPDGYSVFFINNKEIGLLRSEADALNIKATKLALGGDFKNAIKLTNQALKIQDNPYSYRILVAVYILAAQKEQDANIRQRLFEKSLESSKELSGKYVSLLRRDDRFLRGYVMYQLKDKVSYSSFKLGSLFYLKEARFRFNVADHLYLSLLQCTDRDIYSGDNVEEDINESFDEGLLHLRRAKKILKNENSSDYIGPLTWLKKAIADTEKICLEGKAQNKHIGRTDLVMPSEYLINYLDDIKFRGF